MRTKKYISLLMMTTVLAQTMTPAFATQPTCVQDIKDNLENFKAFSSVAAPLTFKPEAESTAAGVLHYAQCEDGKVYIPLGLRNDEDTYCNFGGASDASEMGLEYTAAREAEEESNMIFAHHPRLLRNQPFVDIFFPNHKDGFLYRTYWQEIQYVPTTALSKMADAATENHNKEYRGFKWVAVEDLLEALRNGRSAFEVCGEMISLYDPLFQSLSTETSLHLLNELALRKKISRFSRQTRSLLNRLYIAPEKQEGKEKEKETLQHAPLNIHWDVDVQNLDASMPQQGDLEDEETYRKRVNDFFAYITQYRPLPFKDAQEKDTFAQAVAAHSAAMIEIKRSARFEDEEETEKIEVSKDPFQDLWNPNAELTTSRAHLLIALGPEYKYANDFEGAANPQRLADIANLHRYFNKFTEVAYEQKDVMPEFKRQINLLESDYEILADVLAANDQCKQWPHFFHAAAAELNNLWRSFTALLNHLNIAPLDDFTLGLRGTHIYFRNLKTIQEVLLKLGYHDYNNDRASVILCANYALAAGLQSTKTSSSSVEYFLNDHSVDVPNISKKFEEATALAGFSASYAYYHSLFQQFFASRHPTYNNSVLLSIAMNPEILSNYAYASHGGGSSFKMETEQGEQSDNPFLMLHGIQREAERLQSASETFEIETERKRNLMHEIRIFIHPEIMYNPKLVNIRTFDRFPLTPEIQNKYKVEMTRVTSAMLADWLSQETMVLPDSFIDYPALKTLYKIAYKGTTGEEVQESFASESLVHLVRNGHVEGVQQFIELYPEALERVEPSKLFKAALKGKSTEVLDYILHKQDRSLNEALQFLELREVLVKSYNTNAGMFNHILKSYDFSKFSKEQKLACFKLAMDQDYAVDVLALAKAQHPEILPELIYELMCENEFMYDDKEWSTHISAMLDAGVASAQELLEHYANIFIRSDALKYDEVSKNLLMLIEKGSNIYACHSSTKEPIIFSFFNRGNFEVSHLFLNTLAESPEFVTVQNHEGLTTLQVIQKQYLEGRWEGNVPASTVGYKKMAATLAVRKQNFEEASYGPFTAFLKNDDWGQIYTSITSPNPFAFEEVRSWSLQIDQAKDLQGLIKLIETCPDERFINLAFSKLSRFSSELSPYFLMKEHAKKSKLLQNHWFQKLDAALVNNDMNEANALLDSMPLSLSIYHYIRLNKDFWEHVWVTDILRPALRICESKRQVEKDNWKEFLINALVDCNKDSVLKLIEEAPEADLEKSLKEKILEVWPIDAFYKTAQEKPARVKAWKEELYKLLSAEPIDAKVIENLVLDAPNSAALRGVILNLLRPDLLSILPSLLKKAYPHPADLVRVSKLCGFDCRYSHSTEYRISLIDYVISTIKAPQAIFPILDYAGEHGLKLLQQITSHNFVNLLESLKEQEIEHLLKNYPKLFLYENKESAKDFFLISLILLPPLLRQPFILEHSNKLRENHEDTSFPYFVELVELLNEYPDSIKDLLKQDPRLLDAVGESGFTSRQILEKYSPDIFKNITEDL